MMPYSPASLQDALIPHEDDEVEAAVSAAVGRLVSLYSLTYPPAKLYRNTLAPL